MVGIPAHHLEPEKFVEGFGCGKVFHRKAHGKCAKMHGLSFLNSPERAYHESGTARWVLKTLRLGPDFARTLRNERRGSLPHRDPLTDL